MINKKGQIVKGKTNKILKKLKKAGMGGCFMPALGGEQCIRRL
jgi:hypothetical protein